MEDQIYRERMRKAKFRRRLTLTFILCVLGVGSYAGFLGYRHYHPLSTAPTIKQVEHYCPHRECKPHDVSVPAEEETAPAVLAGLLLVYLVIVSAGSFVLPLDE